MDSLRKFVIEEYLIISLTTYSQDDNINLYSCMCNFQSIFYWIKYISAKDDT